MTTGYRDYGRSYRVELPGKPPFTGSADPAFRGDPSLYNPEDLLLVALSACHMLSYLALAAMEGLAVLDYRDEPSGTMEQVGRGGRFTEVTLRPALTLAEGADLDRARALHAEAHRTCFIASSVSFPVRCEPSFERRAGP